MNRTSAGHLGRGGAIVSLRSRACAPVGDRFSEKRTPPMPARALSEREFIRQFNEAWTPEQLAALLRNPTPEEERALRTYLGPERYRRLYVQAQALGPSRGARPVEGNVVVLPGIMGSELTVADMAQNQTLVWA